MTRPAGICLLSAAFWFITTLFMFTSALHFEKNLMRDISDEQPNQIEENIDVYLNYGDKKLLKPVNSGGYNKLENSVIKSKVDILSRVFNNSVHNFRHKNKKVDVVFLIDSSSSVGKNNFLSEIKFVKKLLAGFVVSYNYTRVAIVTFSSQSQVVRHVDQITEAMEDNDKCKLLNYDLPKIDFIGGGTYTYGAFIEAKEIFSKARRHSKKLIFLITDGFSNGGDPVPIADSLKEDNVTIFTLGIQTGNYAELYNISSSPGSEHSFLLDSFTQFESLARKALHFDSKSGNNINLKAPSFCNSLCSSDQMIGLENGTSTCCDPNAKCTCGTSTGHYSCACDPGYEGTGLKDECKLCPNGTYWHTWNICRDCPDINHVTMEVPALNVSYCVCKSGFLTKGNNKCEVITCPQMSPPENGYFVKHHSGCGQVLNAACGARCKSGFQLVGSSIRLCQANGTWSGTDAHCVLKTCPSLPVPYYGMISCKNSDLNLIFDYTPRNETFMEEYHNDERRVTEPMPIDTDCNFKCGPGFYLVGSNSRNCLPLSKWDGLQTTCKQILCSPLPKVPYASYEPTDCADQKSAHSSNCTVECPDGFERKGPALRTCVGKRSGIWTHKNKSTKCIDITPPIISCPANFSVPMNDDANYAVINYLPPPNVTDNSEINATYWSRPAVKEGGLKLTIGHHTFTYTAMDGFKNKAKCNFSITVMDITPPNLENCVDPFEIYIFPDNNETLIEWDDPIIYDNSDDEVNVTQNLKQGRNIGAGVHQVTYTAIDSSNNTNECMIYVIVKEIKCDILEAPDNGQIVCAKNVTHTWCEVTCYDGFAIFDEQEENHLDSTQLMCENKNGTWRYEYVPDCTEMALPDSVEHIFSIPIDNQVDNCIDKNNTEALNEIITNLKTQICGDQEDCEILTEIPDCVNTTLSDDGDADKTFYNIVKREVVLPQVRIPQQQRNRTTLKVKVYTRISKKLGLWDKTGTRSQNIKRIKAELKNVHQNEELQQKLFQLGININHIKIDEFIKCQIGSVAKKQICVKCPRGTFHNTDKNVCQACLHGTYANKPGQALCIPCPEHYSTRKSGTKAKSECKAQCIPGTIGRIKKRQRHPNNQKVHKTLMPYCKKCPPGQYQPFYDQTQCEDCPNGFTAPRGSASRADCQPKYSNICLSDHNICGDRGVCRPEPHNSHAYSCVCDDDYIGSHCEHHIDQCLSAPCHNGGTCHHHNGTTIACHCPQSYIGRFCEIYVDPCSSDYCNNGGTCIDADGLPTCECAAGFEGETCARMINTCMPSPCYAGRCVSSIDGFQCHCPPGVIGRRCNRRPCDYMPCHRNAICVDLQHFPASRDSFTCLCPKGLKGYNCTKISNPCEKRPCRNNAECVPMAIRDPNVVVVSSLDEELYEQFQCVCPPYFYGELCDVLVTPDFVMEFTKPSIDDYVKIEGPKYPLDEISVCAWIQSNDTNNYGTILSYASESGDNMFTMTDYNGFAIYVNGEHIVTDIELNDGMWHFLCTLWSSRYDGLFQIYLDGVSQNTGHLSANKSIEANGIIVLGQEQDEEGARFSESESFIGKMAYLDIWDQYLSEKTIKELYTSCEPYQGDLYSWTDFKQHVVGNVKILPSPFCKSCRQYIYLRNGKVRYLGNRAFHQCNVGFQLEGPVARDCLRTSQWSSTPARCIEIRCRPLPYIHQGRVSVSKYTLNGIASYSCYDSHNLVGDIRRICQENGQWTGEAPICVNTIACPRLHLSNSQRVLYANEQGPIYEEMMTYPLGTIAEFNCVRNATMYGDNLLTCTENGSWDISAPECRDPNKKIVLPPNILIPSSDERRELISFNFSEESRHSKEDVRKWATTFSPTEVKIIRLPLEIPKTQITSTTIMEDPTTTSKPKTSTLRSTSTTRRTTTTTMMPSTTLRTTTSTLRTTAATTRPTTTSTTTTRRTTTTTTRRPTTTTTRQPPTTTTRQPPTTTTRRPTTTTTKPPTTTTTRRPTTTTKRITTKTPEVTTIPITIPTTTEFIATSTPQTTSSTTTLTTISTVPTTPKTTTTTEVPTTPSTTTTIPTTSTIIPTTQAIVTSTQATTNIQTSPTFNPVQATVIKKCPLDPDFIKIFREFIYRGCSVSNPERMPKLCASTIHKSRFTSEAQYTLQDSDNNSTESNLLQNLHRADQLIQNDTIGEMTFENWYDFIIYGRNITTPETRLPDKMENFFRVIMIFYMDAVGAYGYGSELPASENRTQEIKRLLAKMISIAGESVHKVKPTVTLQQNQCDTKEILDPVEASIMANVTNDDDGILIETASLREHSLFVPPRTQVRYICNKGFRLEGHGLSECDSNGHWSKPNYTCEPVFCENPPRPVTMEPIWKKDRYDKFMYGEELELKCKEGHTMYGKSKIQCMDSGKWTKIRATCAKISCKKPKLPPDASILSGHSYLFQDKLKIECDETEVVEIECRANGKWHPYQIC